MDTEKWRRVVERDLARVQHEIAELRSEPPPEELQSFGDNTPLSEDVDAAVAVENLEFRIRIRDRLVERAAELEDALRRIEDGTYGTCIVCGEKISEKRLLAVPEALRCARHQEEAEQDEGFQEDRELKRLEEDYQERRKIERKGL